MKGELLVYQSFIPGVSGMHIIIKRISTQIGPPMRPLFGGFTVPHSLEIIPPSPFQSLLSRFSYMHLPASWVDFEEGESRV